MIVDVYTHTPHGHTASPSGRPAARPSRADSDVVSQDDFLRAMEYVDRAIVFGIALPPGDPTTPAVPPEASAATASEVNEGTRLPRVPLDELQEILHRDALSLLGLA